MAAVVAIDVTDIFTSYVIITKSYGYLSREIEIQCPLIHFKAIRQDKMEQGWCTTSLLLHYIFDAGVKTAVFTHPSMPVILIVPKRDNFYGNATTKNIISSY